MQEVFAGSAHGKALDNPNAPTCASCHGKHDILPHSNPAATTSAKNLPYTCASCHHKIVLKEDSDIRITDSFDRYMKGIHAEGISKGIGSAASCNDCHGTHDLYKASDPRSLANKMNIPKTCSKCHNDIYIQYERGIHGKALAAGILDAPNCTDCHGEHEIRKIDDPKAPVNQSNLAEYVCGKCHNDPQLVEKYGLPEGRFTSYQDSYHGLAVRGGSLKAANCVSCHKAHDVLPSSNDTVVNQQGQYRADLSEVSSESKPGLCHQLYSQDGIDPIQPSRLVGAVHLYHCHRRDHRRHAWPTTV